MCVCLQVLFVFSVISFRLRINTLVEMKSNRKRKQLTRQQDEKKKKKKKRAESTCSPSVGKEC